MVGYEGRSPFELELEQPNVDWVLFLEGGGGGDIDRGHCRRSAAWYFDLFDRLEALSLSGPDVYDKLDQLIAEHRCHWAEGSFLCRGLPRVVELASAHTLEKGCPLTEGELEGRRARVPAVSHQDAGRRP
jgi:hypothetical protein